MYSDCISFHFIHIMAAASFSSLSPHLRPHPPFTPIQECEREGKEEDESCDQNSFKATPSDYSETSKESNYVHQPTPLHQTSKSTTVKSSKKRPETNKNDERGGGVSCNKCRPGVREKFSVVPLDTSTVGGRHSNASPNGLFKSIFSSLVKKSPRSTSSSSETEGLTPAPGTEDQWKAAVAQLSHKLIQASKKRDEAILEASRLKFSMAELEKKLNKLEIYCHNLKSGLDDCANIKTAPKHEPIKIGNHDRVIEHFLISVSESRSSMRHLSRSLTVQLPLISGGKLYDRIQLLLQPYDIIISASTNPRIILLYLEALLNRAFFEDFESPGFQKSGSNNTLNPIQKCEENFKCFMRLKELSWEEVLNKGTKQFSEEFSKFCDRKMSEVVSMLGWTRAWPEPLLQAFFGASKAVWLVHLLANSVHPGLPIFRVDKGVRFDSIYMEDMGGDKAKKFVSPTVRVMVEPGFYIYGNVVKCKVICRYHNNNNNVFTNDKPL